MKCRIVLFYKDEEALLNYLLQFCHVEQELIVKTKCRWHYIDDGFSIVCIKGFGENIRGHKAHIFGVQEELTWGNEWPEIRDCVLRPALISPIDIQVFDGVSKEEAERVDTWVA